LNKKENTRRDEAPSSIGPQTRSLGAPLLIVIEMKERYPKKSKRNALPSKLNLFLSRSRSRSLGLFRRSLMAPSHESVARVSTRLCRRSKRFSLG
jgi:hypothetical protein